MIQVEVLISALVIGFNVPASKSVKDSAAQKHVELHLESVIYRLIETVRKKTSALLKPTIESRTLGEGLVSEVFTIRLSRKAQTVVAGTKCGNGTISKNDNVRVIRGSKREVVFDGKLSYTRTLRSVAHLVMSRIEVTRAAGLIIGKISTLKHLKKEVDEIRKGMDCGISLDGFDDIKEGDEIVTYKTFEVPREL
jgi:translation initiation factor IF-2